MSSGGPEVEPSEMQWPRARWVSERHLRVELAGEPSPRVWGLVRAAARRVKSLAGVVDVTPAYATVLVEFDVGALGAPTRDTAEHEPNGPWQTWQVAVMEALRGLESEDATSGRVVEVPVCYEGEYAPDIGEVAGMCGLREGEVASAHCGAEYIACFVGFMPGFAYLSGLPRKIAVPRLERPRVRVPAGSVGIAGEQTGVYPFASPGGWRLIGRTPLRMFDPERERPALVEMGDRVRFCRIGAEEFGRLEEAERRSREVDCRVGCGRGLLVIEPGMLTTVQDFGRRGLAAMGVPRGGAADPGALCAGNRIVGNEEGAAGLEVSLTGATVEVERDAVVAVTGAEADVEIDGVMSPHGAGHRVKPGSRVRVGPMKRGARAYLCVSGGLDVPRVLGSAATNLGAGFGGFGGRALRRGDRLALGDARHHDASEGVVERRGSSLRIIVDRWRGFSLEAIEGLLGGEYRVASQSDRVGVRLEGPTIRAPAGGRMVSEGMMWGAVQVPEDGKPIVLMCDHPTTGGYPVIACVIAADLGRLGQLRPGDRVRFEEVDRASALAALNER